MDRRLIVMLVVAQCCLVEVLVCLDGGDVETAKDFGRYAREMIGHLVREAKSGQNLRSQTARDH